MERRAFDGLARSVGEASSRRVAFSLLASIALGSVLTRLGLEESAAKRQHGRHRGHHPGKHKRNRKGKRKGGQGQSTACVPLDQACSVLGDPCCTPTTCQPTATLLVTTCQLACHSTSECQHLLNTTDVQCVHDAVACPGLTQCCRPTMCANPGGKCPGGGPCCVTLSHDPRCCAKGQHCAPGGGCAT